jgi:glutaminyl-peptide cyclotransferase
MALTKALCDLGPRAANTSGGKQAAEWLAGQCREIPGVKVEIDEWQEDTASGEYTFRNVVAEIPGTRPGFIIVGSHYDTKVIKEYPDFIGANDGGSSNGLLIAILQELATPGYWQGPTIRAVFFDGEEARIRYTFNDGLHGSRREAERASVPLDPDRPPSAENKPGCHAMILMDMIGDEGLGITFPNNCDRDLVRKVFALSETQGTRKHFGHYVRGNLLDDHTPFVQKGIPAINFIDFTYGPRNTYWHTGEDTIDKLSPESFSIVGNAVLALLAELAAE